MSTTIQVENDVYAIVACDNCGEFYTQYLHVPLRCVVCGAQLKATWVDSRVFVRTETVEEE
jgi:uncharacterized protein (DUF983 family)